MASLQMHQLRVAAVAKTICDNFRSPLDGSNVAITCLFHDMGNIIKSDLTYFPEFVKPEGLEYWQKVKDEFVQKYGTDEHVATRAIAREIPLPSPALAYLDTIGFYNLKNVLEGPSFEEKICSYSDMRVGPYGVLLLEERLAEANKRYAGRNHPLGSDKFDTLADAVREIENQIFGQTDIKPEDITDQKIQRAIVELKDLRIA